jgi:lipopolysaccharide/colanic/teichoic acid biosynthesis glycosyltransferase
MKSVDFAGAKGLPRGFDFIVSLGGLILCLPLLVVSALAVALTSPGGVLFRQKRVGRNGEIFIIYKLRTMRAASAGPQVTGAATGPQVASNGPQVTTGNDQRITRVGRFLRKTKLDELPTLLNVLRGDMALVGPRPEVPRYVKLEDPMWQAVLAARPGITDPVTLHLRNEEKLLAQVEGDMEKYYLDQLQPLKLKGYVSYLEQRSWRSDLKVLWQTVAAVVIHSPRRHRGH